MGRRAAPPYLAVGDVNPRLEYEYEDDLERAGWTSGGIFLANSTPSRIVPGKFDMKKPIFRDALPLVLLVVFLNSLPALAQMPDAAGGVNSAMIKLFGDHLGFTARADVQVFNSNRVMWFQMPSAFAAAETKFRVDVDLKLARSSTIKPATIATFKQLGLDRVTSVIRPDKKAIYIIYPGAQSYANMPIANEDAELATQRVEKKALGRETIDGHACIKNLSTVKSPKGVVLLQATTWNAADLKEFPVKIETRENGSTTVMHFQQITLGHPDPKLFEPPAGYKQYGNPQDLLVAAYKKIPGGTKK
jgi:hypothetical protein